MGKAVSCRDLSGTVRRDCGTYKGLKMAMLRGLKVRIEGDYYFFGSRKYYREACPATLRKEIEKAVAAANSGKKTPAKRKSNNVDVITRYAVTATGKQARKNPRT